MVGHGITGRGTWHPRGSQECAHTNKIHIPSPQISPLAQIFSLSCLFSPAHIPAAFTWLYSVRAPQSSLSTSQPHPAEMWGALSPSCCWPWLAKLACTSQGQTPLTCTGEHTRRDDARAMWRGRRVPAVAGLCPEELGERDLLQGREFSSVCRGDWLLRAETCGKKSLDPHPEFHSSAPGTGRGREDRTGHFQQPCDLFIKASSHQPCLPPPPSPPQLTLGFINAVALRLEGITSQETFQSQISFRGDQREPRVGGVPAGRSPGGELAAWERCKTALAAPYRRAAAGSAPRPGRELFPGLGAQGSGPVAQVSAVLVATATRARPGLSPRAGAAPGLLATLPPAPARTGSSGQEWELAPRRLAPQVNCGVP